jgi:hypothetical protein
MLEQALAAKGQAVLQERRCGAGGRPGGTAQGPGAARRSALTQPLAAWLAGLLGACTAQPACQRLCVLCAAPPYRMRTVTAARLNTG